MRVEIPKNWHSVTIKQFHELSKVKADQTEETDSLDLAIEIISIMSGVERQRLFGASLKAIRELWSALSFIENTSFEDKCQQRIKVNGVSYYADFDTTKMCAGQYMDFKHYMKSADVIGNLHNILAIFYIPVGKRYNDKPQPEIAEDFYNELPISVAYPVAVFFCQLSSEWMNHISLSIESQTRKILSEVK